MFRICDLFDPGGVFKHLDPSDTTNTPVVRTYRKHTKEKSRQKSDSSWAQWCRCLVRQSSSS